MKKSLNNIIIAIFLLIIAGCNNDFLNDNIDNPTTPAGESTLIISPEWEPADYLLHLPGMGNANFEITAKPAWLQMGSTSGTLSNSMASIRCSASKVADFSKIGFYLDRIEATAGNRTFNIPVAYLTEGNPKIGVERKIQISLSGQLGIRIQNTGTGILIWDVVSLPDWLEVDKNFEITPAVMSHSPSFLPLTINVDKFVPEENSGRVVLKTNDKDNPIVEIEITLDFGKPDIYFPIHNERIDFGATETTFSADINAWGSGLLVWHFENLPEWLTISPAKGAYRTHTYYEDIVFTCDRAKLQPGVNSAVIHLKSNADNTPSIAITVVAHAPGDNANVRPLDANITDAAFDKNTNTLYYVASTPNKFVAYNADERSVLYEIPLGKAPTCFTTTDDYTQVAVGHGGQITFIDLQSKQATTTDIDAIVYDIAWGADDWFCYTVETHYSLYWINATDFTTHETDDRSAHYSNGIIKKIPGLPYVVATRVGSSPSGFIVYNASSRSLNGYSHTDLSNFWFADNGQYIFDLYGNVYRSSSVIVPDDSGNSSFSPIGKLKGNNTDYYYYSYTWMDHSSAACSIWTINNDHAIYQYDDNDYTYQRTCFYFDVYQPEGQSVYEVEARYLFANKEGTELSVLRKGKDNNNWSIEFVGVMP